jgi:hypothetical protein
MSEESDPAQEFFETAFDWSEKAPSNAVVETVSAVCNQQPTALGPLYESIDPDGLDTLIQSADNERSAASLQISFVFAGLVVSVYGSGKLTVELSADE